MSDRLFTWRIVATHEADGRTIEIQFQDSGRPPRAEMARLLLPKARALGIPLVQPRKGAGPLETLGTYEFTITSIELVDDEPGP